jgi:flagellar basal-body rod protein FlgG
MKARLTGGFEANPDGVVSMKTPSVRQGALETSNVTTAAEMVSVMAALRRAEAGQRLAIVYDDLMGRAITSFGQN